MSFRHNNFDALRLLGALLVALGHTMGIVLGYDGLGKLTNNQSFGGIGLNIFCTISGFLIVKSRLRNSMPSFFKSRALRILPALIVAIPLMAFALGPCVTSLPLHRYFSSGGTWRFLATAMVLPLNPELPGVFGGAGLVGQLYSLTAEVVFYILVGMLGGWRHFSKVMVTLLIVTWAVFLNSDYNSLPFSQIFRISVYDTTVFFYPVRLGTLCFFYLFSGSALALLEISPIYLGRMTFIAIPVWVIALFSNNRLMYDMVEMAMLPIAVLGIGLMSRYALRIPERLGDISFGLYIYHFAAAELVFLIASGHKQSWTVVLLSLLLSIFLGWLSFQLVEKKALSHKKNTI
jgi:peptidoglycan/LPS O-acetylase OafA/YrhL